MGFETIALNVEDGLAFLTFNRPASMNAVNLAMLEELDAAFTQMQAAESGIRCLLITGEGRGFCAGADLSDGRLAKADTDTRDVGRTLETHYHPLLKRMKAFDAPIVTAVNGAAAGIGMSFALMGDLVIAGRSAYFLQAFRHIGLVPDGGATWLLPRIVGRARALELSLLGERLPAERALEWGLINRVVDDERLREDATALARELASGPTVGLGLIRKAYWASLENSYEDQLAHERASQYIAGQTDDFMEGVSAFLEKRKPIFKGR